MTRRTLASFVTALLVTGVAGCHLGGEPPVTEPGDPAVVTGPTVITATVGGTDTSDTVTIDIPGYPQAIRFGCSSNVQVTTPSGPLSCTGSADSAIILPHGTVLTITAAAPDTSYILGFVAYT